MRKEVLYATSTLIGTIIGAGVLGIPYVVAKSGFLLGFLNIAILTFAVLMIHLYYGEVVLRTKGHHQLSGYAGKYLGKWGKRIATFSLIFGIYGALIAYIIGEGDVLSAIFGVSPLFASVIFFIFASAIVYAGLKTISRFDFYLMSVAIIFCLTICAFLIPKVSLANLSTIDVSYAFYPFGVVLFALIGMSAVPEVHSILAHDQKYFKRAIMFGVLFSAVFYMIFAFVVVGALGTGTTDVATIGIGLATSPTMIIFANLFAVLVMATSFLSLGIALTDMYHYDFKFHRFAAFALSCIVPLVLFLIGVKNFISTIAIAGAMTGGLDSILITLMFWKAKKHGDREPEYELHKSKLFGIVLILVFVLGAAYQAYTMIK